MGAWIVALGKWDVGHWDWDLGIGNGINIFRAF